MSLTPRGRLALLLTLTPLALLCGCGSDDLVSVSGSATLDGAPLPNATVLFSPDPAVVSTTATSATAVTDSGGKFKMGTRGTGDGVRPGKYKVTITNEFDPYGKSGGHPSEAFQQKQAAGQKTSQDDYKKMEEAARKEAHAKAKKTPPVYTDVIKTPFSIEVPSQRDIKLELKSDGK